MMYESLVMLGVLAVLFMLPQLALGLGAGITLSGPLLLFHVFVVLGGYCLWYWHRGQTLAMQTWKLRLQSVDGSPCSWQQLALRYLIAWPSILFYGVGLIWALFDRDRQFLHDRLAGTRIIFAPPTKS